MLRVNRTFTSTIFLAKFEYLFVVEIYLNFTGKIATNITETKHMFKSENNKDICY